MSEVLNNNLISIIVPVYNEEEIINDFILNLYAQFDKKSFELIIVDGEAYGSTINKIDFKSNNFKTILSASGRANQMNTGAELANGEILLFLHADTKLPDNSFVKIEEALNNKNIVGGAFDLKIDSDKTIFKIISNISTHRSRATRLPYGDQAQFFKKDYFLKIGRYKNIALMEDIEIMQRVKRLGDTIEIINESVLTSARRWEQEGIFYCTLRNWTILTLFFFGVSPSKLAKYYRRKKDEYK